MARTPLDEAAKEFEAILTGVGDLDTDDLERALQAGADVLIDAWRPRIPRRTGQLSDSPVMETQQKDFTGGVTVAVGPDKRGWYFHFVELGTVHSTAQPSLRPAFDAELDRIAATIASELDTILFSAHGVGRL